MFYEGKKGIIMVICHLEQAVSIFTEEFMKKRWAYTRMRWSQEKPARNADPDMVELTIPHPIKTEI